LSPILGKGQPTVGQYKRFAAYAIFAYSLFRSKDSPARSKAELSTSIYTNPFALPLG
jgi:hypothetical protein